jgi:hypothetical protein
MLGYSKIILNLIWIFVCVFGIIYSYKGVNYLETVFKDNLDVIDSNIGILKNLLHQSIDVIESVERSIGTIEVSSMDAGFSLTDTRPIINKTSQVVTQDLPLALDEVQTSMPNVIDTASMIDRTLYILSMFKFSIPNPFGEDFELNLGIDYQPEVTLEDSLVQLFSKLDGVPERMRSLEGDLNLANTNLDTMSENLLDVAHDLDFIRAEIREIIPEINKLISNLETIQDSISKTANRIQRTIGILQKIFVCLLVLIILSQVHSIIIGYLITKGEFVNSIKS